MSQTALLEPLPVEDATRREFLHGVGATVLALALFAACGSDDESDASSETITVDGVFGPVTIPAAPERIVAGDSVTLTTLLALDIKPIAAAVNRNSLPGYLDDQMDGVEDITAEEGGIDLEHALSLDPDLIITSVGVTGGEPNEERYRQYQAAVPTFGYTHHYVYIEQIVSNITEVARVLDREERAQELVEAYEERTAELRQRVADAGLGDRPVSVVRLSQDGNYSIRIGTSESIAFRALGIAQPESQRNPEDFRIDLSLENLNVLNEADTVFLYVDDNAAAEFDAVTSNAVWQSLEPVKNGRVHRVNSGIWNSIDIVGLMRILDDIETYFITPAEAAT